MDEAEPEPLGEAVALPLPVGVGPEVLGVLEDPAGAEVCEVAVLVAVAGVEVGVVTGFCAASHAQIFANAGSYMGSPQ